VVFQNRYVELGELCQFLAAADLYVTPYLGEQQITSGTLAYGLGAGKAVVSTPYSYAQEVLADGRGRLVPFRNSAAIADEVRWLLEHEVQRQAMRKQADMFMPDAVWSQVARSYLDVFQSVCEHPAVSRGRRLARPGAASLQAVPELKLDHLRCLTDDIGIVQHARFTIPDRRYGYTTDDNARALALAVEAYRMTPTAELFQWVQTYLAFVGYADNESEGRFRNFMGYDRRWLEEVGSEDSHARALWGLGVTVSGAPHHGIRAAALDLFQRALPAVEGFSSPRAWAFAQVGIHAYLQHYGGDSDARRLRGVLAERLLQAFTDNATEDWPGPKPS
jgi:hypothetical protein